MTRKQWREKQRNHYGTIAAGLAVYLAACVGSFLSRYLEEYMGGATEIEFHFSWEIALITAVLGFIAAAVADRDKGEMTDEAMVAKRHHWKKRAIDALAYGVMIDATLGKVLDFVVSEV